jgi:hypothetical protein
VIGWVGGRLERPKNETRMKRPKCRRPELPVFGKHGWMVIPRHLADRSVLRVAPVKLKPKLLPWAHEMRIQDVDGNTLWLGTEPRD